MEEMVLSNVPAQYGEDLCSLAEYAAKKVWVAVGPGLTPEEYAHAMALSLRTTFSKLVAVTRNLEVDIKFPCKTGKTVSTKKIDLCVWGHSKEGHPDDMLVINIRFVDILTDEIVRKCNENLYTAMEHSTARIRQGLVIIMYHNHGHDRMDEPNMKTRTPRFVRVYKDEYSLA
jgi:hypothetical protein